MLKVRCYFLILLLIFLVDGEPPPSVNWTFEGNNLEKVNIENEDYLSKFSIAKAIRKQSGKYTITAKNDSGTDSVTIQVIIKLTKTNADIFRLK